MKNLVSLIVIAFLLQSSVTYAQPSPAPETDGTASGKVVLPDNSIVTGTVKDNIRKKGEVVVLTGEKKTKFKAGDISTAQIGKSLYITWNYTFYEVIFQGKNLMLLRKANEPAGVQYNGPDAVVINSDGKVDDLFLRKNGDASLLLLTKKNVKEVLSVTCNSCATAIDASKFDAESLKKAVETCDDCK